MTDHHAAARPTQRRLPERESGDHSNRNGNTTMNLRRIFVLLLIIVILLLARPRESWQQARHAWAQRERVLRVVTFALIIYLAYGFFQLYRQGWFEW
ncbi:MAG: hypothetical protein KDD78_10035 [Caldilineaceae bacterium]|nr:hypothetical protein [Caldilineaceae bacterium]